jgi:peptidoglycan-associated lipoprotein
MQMALRPRGAKIALALTAVLAISACAKNAADEAGPGGFGAPSYGRNGAGPGSAQDFAANVGDRVFFETDSTDLTSTAQATLDKQADWLNRYSRYAFTIEGHADERGTREYNFALGARRAEAAKNYLISRGVAASRMRTVSYGKERPVAVCDDISCWSQNRRAVTVLSGGGNS